MRIISGKYKGRKFIMPSGIRPTRAKVRKALFDILGDIEGLSFLELFAGSGAIGLEACSRGAAQVIMVESSRLCLAALEKNLASLSCRGCTVLPIQVEKALELLCRAKERFDMVFLDPPYYKGLAKKTLLNLSTYDILAPNGFIVVEHFKKENLPETLGVLTLFKQKTYGDTLLSFYKKTS